MHVCVCVRAGRKDQEIYDDFRKEFPELDVATVNEDALKSPESKEQWRNMLGKYDKVVDDYNWATLMRLRCSEPYSESNCTLGTPARVGEYMRR